MTNVSTSAISGAHAILVVASGPNSMVVRPSTSVTVAGPLKRLQPVLPVAVLFASSSRLGFACSSAAEVLTASAVTMLCTIQLVPTRGRSGLATVRSSIVTTWSMEVRVSLLSASAHFGSLPRRLPIHSSAVARSPMQAIIVVATSPVFRIPPDRSTAAVARLQPAVPGDSAVVEGQLQGPPPGIGVPVTSVETYLCPSVWARVGCRPSTSTRRSRRRDRGRTAVSRIRPA